MNIEQKLKKKKEKLRAYLVLFFNLYFLKTKTRIKMVFYNSCILNLSMYLELFFVFYILN